MGFIKWFVPYMYKTSWLMLILFIVLATLDFISTFSTGEIAQYLEANPLYMLGIGFPGVILMNLFVLWIILRLYDNYYKVHRQFMILSTFIWFSILRIIVIINNFSVVKEIQKGAMTKEIAMEVTTSAKFEYYIMSVVLFLYAPLLINWLIYGLFLWEHKVVQK